MIALETVAMLVAGGIASQFWKAQPGSAATEDAPGSAKLNAAPARKATSASVAKVGKEIVTEDMLARECIARHGREVLDDLINRLIIQQACEAEGKVVSQTEVEQEIVKIAKRFNLDPVEWQKMLLSERNITPEQYRISVIWPMLALRKLAETSAQEKIDDEELVTEFERQYGERVKCRMIMLDNLRRAQDVWNQCKKAPDNFEKLAQEHSVDPNSKSLGGAIPPIPMHSGNETIEKAVFKLEKGEISGVVEIPTEAGTRYAILKCEGRTEPVVDDIEEVREQLYEELVERKTQESVAKVFAKIKADTRVDNYLTNTTSHSETATVNPAAKAPAGAKKPSNIKQTSAEKTGVARPKAPAASAAGSK